MSDEATGEFVESKLVAEKSWDLLRVLAAAHREWVATQGALGTPPLAIYGAGYVASSVMVRKFALEGRIRDEEDRKAVEMMVGEIDMLTETIDLPDKEASAAKKKVAQA